MQFIRFLIFTFFGTAGARYAVTTQLAKVYQSLMELIWPSKQDPLVVHALDTSISLPIHWGFMPQVSAFYADIALGNPQQPFRVLLELRWGGLAVRSTDCHTRGLWGVREDCGEDPPYLTYNGSASVSYSDAHLRAFSPCTWSSWSGEITGNLSFDSLQLGRLPVKNTLFSEIGEYDFCSVLALAFFEYFDGTIGLGRPRITSQTWYNDSNRDTALAIPNLMHHLTTEIPMKNKVMILNLPKGPDHPGKLTVGGTTPEVDFRLPLVDDESTERVNLWIVRLNQVALQSNPPLTFPDLRLSVAITLESNIVVALPKTIARTILKAVGIEYIDQFRIDCAKRQSLPDLLIEFEGLEIVLQWQDYTVESQDDEDGRKECAVMITSVKEESVGDPEMAYIGHGLLRKYEVVFDMDNNEIGFRSLQ